MHEIAQIYLSFHLSSTINLVFFFMENYHKRDTCVKNDYKKLFDHKKNQMEEKFARLTTMKDSLGKK